MEILVGVATKDDIRALDTKIDHSVADLQKDIKLLGTEISAKISAESNATFLRMIWVVGLGVAFLAGLLTLLAYLPAQGG